MLPTFQKLGLYGENDGPSILGKLREKYVFKLYQMIAYVECSSNQ